MGMYDTFGDDYQLKIFPVPIFAYDSHTGDSCFYYSGGSLNHYSAGDPVPWRSLWYNYGKNFSVVDVEPLSDNALIYVFRDGVFREVIDDDALFTDEYADAIYPGGLVLDRNGDLMKISSAVEADDFFWSHFALDRAEERAILNTENIDKVINDTFNAIPVDDEEKRTICRKAIMELSNLRYELATPQREELTAFYKYHSDEVADFMKFGGYIECVNKYVDTDAVRWPQELRDALMEEAHNFVINNGIVLEKYFAWNETPEDERVLVTAIDKKIREWKKKEGD